MFDGSIRSFGFQILAHEYKRLRDGIYTSFKSTNNCIEGLKDNPTRDRRINGKEHRELTEPKVQSVEADLHSARRETKT